MGRRVVDRVDPQIIVGRQRIHIAAARRADVRAAGHIEPLDLLAAAVRAEHHAVGGPVPRAVGIEIVQGQQTALRMARGVDISAAGDGSGDNLRAGDRAESRDRRSRRYQARHRPCRRGCRSLRGARWCGPDRSKSAPRFPPPAVNVSPPRMNQSGIPSPLGSIPESVGSALKSVLQNGTGSRSCADAGAAHVNAPQSISQSSRRRAAKTTARLAHTSRRHAVRSADIRVVPTARVDESLSELFASLPKCPAV